MKIVFLGSDGQLGKSLKKYFNESEKDYFFFNKKQLDITDHSAVKEKITSIKPNFVINACAYTSVDSAEENFDKANDINNISVGNLANECLKNKCLLVHISTDYVFDGLSKYPYKEDDKKNPTGVYGRTKLEGENKIISSGCKFCIIRTSWVFSENGKNFLKTILNIASRNDSISIVSDQIGAPTFSDDISNAIKILLTHMPQDNYINEIYHYSGAPFCSWYEFAKNIINIAIEDDFLKRKPEINKILSKDFPTLAKRPINSRLSSEKILESFDIKPSDWKSGIRKVITSLK
jgi:dTDP-4-dehydrorhamnose reductase